MDNHDVFATNLSHLIESRGKTRKQVSEDLGINYFTLTSWINGVKYPRMDKVERLAKYFGVKKSDLIEPQIKKTEELSPSVQQLMGYVRNLSEEQAARVYQAIQLLLGENK